MIRSRFFTSLLTAAALQLALPNVVAAQTTQASTDETARARDLFRQGAAAMKDGKFQEARKALLQVWNIRQSYDVAAVLGQAELELKAYRDAAEHLDFALKNLAPRESAETLANIKNGLATAKQHVGEVKLTVNEPNASITLDGKAIGSAPLPSSLFVDPGPHVLKAQLGTDRVASQTIQASAGSTYTVELSIPAEGPATAPSSGLGDPTPPPSPPPASNENGPSIVPVIIGGSIVVIGAGLGIGYRLAASSKEDESQALKQAVGNTGCKTGAAAAADCEAAHDAAQSVAARRDISTAGFVVAGAALVGTAVYWLWPRSQSERAAQKSNFMVIGAPSAHGGSMFVSGSF